MNCTIVHHSSQSSRRRFISHFIFTTQSSLEACSETWNKIQYKTTRQTKEPAHKWSTKYIVCLFPLTRSTKFRSLDVLNYRLKRIIYALFVIRRRLLLPRAFFRRSSSGTCCNEIRCVDDRITGGATFAFQACFHRPAHRHQRSPARNPGNPFAGLGDDKSLPCERV
jgi:hypothetical protein